MITARVIETNGNVFDYIFLNRKIRKKIVLLMSESEESNVSSDMS
jgi:hypothetical protein